MNNLKDLTVIIVTFKTNEEILFNCLDSIKKEVKILLVENSTNQEFKKKIENKYNNITAKFINLSKQLFDDLPLSSFYL